MTRHKGIPTLLRATPASTACALMRKPGRIDVACVQSGTLR
jgi:hypothetical protein